MLYIVFYLAGVFSAVVVDYILYCKSNKNEKEVKKDIVRVNGDSAYELSKLHRDIEKEPIIEFIYKEINSAIENGLFCINQLDNKLRYNFNSKAIEIFYNKYTPFEVQQYFIQDSYSLEVYEYEQLNDWRMIKISWGRR